MRQRTRRTGESETASAAYTVRMSQAKGALARINTLLDAHAKRASAAPEHWGFTGDLGEITSRLQEIERFLAPAAR